MTSSATCQKHAGVLMRSEFWTILGIVLAALLGVIAVVHNSAASCDRVDAVAARVDRQEQSLDRIEEVVRDVREMLLRRPGT